MSSELNKSLRLLVFLVLAIFLINFLGNIFFFKIDLTDDKRFTLTDETKQMLEGIDENISISIILDGDLSAEYLRLQKQTAEMLDQFAEYCPYLDYKYEDPNLGSIEEVNQNRKELEERLIFPVNDPRTEQILYPYAILRLGERGLPINLLEKQSMGEDLNQLISKSVNLLEYKLANGIDKLAKKKKDLILFTKGHRELFNFQTASLENLLSKYYAVDHIDLSQFDLVPEETKLLVIAKPRESFSDLDRFKIDQYVMRGGNLICLLDQFNVAVDSISNRDNFIPNDINHGLEDLLFKYGLRINYDLVSDLSSSRIPQVIGTAGGKAQTEMFNWYYHTIVVPKSEHPITKNLGPVNLFFPSSIDTLKTAGKVKKTVLLESSVNSRKQASPVQLSFEMLKLDPNPQAFSKGPFIHGVMLEGNFESNFKNRLVSEYQNILSRNQISFKESSEEAKIMLVSDADFISNLYNPNTKSLSPVGFNKWERFTFDGNESFILNAIEYMMDDSGLLKARNKELKMRLLNQAKIDEEKSKWQLINMIVPLVYLLILAFVFNFIRRRLYA